MNNNSCNNDKSEKIIREYTIYQIQNLFKIVIYANNLLKENNFLIKELNENGKKNTEKYQKRLKFKLKLTKIVKKTGDEIIYILKYPERIKIREVPIGGILNQRTMIRKSNRDKEYKIRNLRKMFFDVKSKFTINYNHVPDEYSTDYLDNSIRIHRKLLEKLILLKEKLSGKKEFYDIMDDNDKRIRERSFLEYLFNCPVFPKKNLIFYNNDKNEKMNEIKKINEQENKFRESEKSTLHKIEKILTNLS